MRILVLVPDLAAAGGVSAFFNSLQGQFKQHEVEYFTRGSRPKVGRLKQLVLKFSDYLRFIRLLSTGGYDLVHINTSLGKKNLWRDPWFALIAKLFKRKTLVFFHGWKPDCINASNKWLLSILLKVDGIVVLAREFEDRLRQWNYQGRTFVEATVVSKQLESMLSQAKTRKLADRVRILFLSRIEIPKGVYESVQAFKLFRQAAGIQSSLVIAGDGSELNKLKEYIEQEDIQDVSFCGFVSGEAKSNVLKDADIYLLPSYSEGMPISVLEAMLAGMAVVTRSTGGLVDFFTNNMGRITDSKDPQVLADLLISIISNPSTLSEISDFNRRYAKDNFTVDPFIRRLEAIYKSI